jgi:hypothetical protein
MSAGVVLANDLQRLFGEDREGLQLTVMDLQPCRDVNPFHESSSLPSLTVG